MVKCSSVHPNMDGAWREFFLYFFMGREKERDREKERERKREREKKRERERK